MSATSATSSNLCHEQQPLIARDDSGHNICGPCAGMPGIYTCLACGKGGRLYADGRCPRCVLLLRLEEHLAGPDGQVSCQLRPLQDALAAANDPRGVLCWLRRSPNAHLLGELAASGKPLSHDLLDELPPSRYEHYVRQTLVHTGVLPERHEDLDRIPAWLDQLLADRPAQHAALIRPFVHWFLLKRARRRAAHRGPHPRPPQPVARGRQHAQLLHPLPPKLARLLGQLAEGQSRQARIKTDGPGQHWLFPGLLPGRPAAPSGFSRKLLDHGIDARPARNAALIALLEDVPPPILADLLGLHINTAVRWANIARRDWTDYLAARDQDTTNTAPSE
ncbi:hypothetical protein ABZU75_41935 [Streptosporangium sp. NPDC005286]|uniref:hypothetical protein n=1 Tax=Streptosporangium sp. NPDC005286 TaxID=3154463 RepID=UPI0033B24824